MNRDQKSEVGSQKPELIQFSDQNQWPGALTRDFQKILEDAIRARGRTVVALSGGSTPRPFYRRLNQTALPWEKIEWWLGDERWVPPTDGASNEKMARETLGLNQPEFDAHFHSWHLDPSPEAAAAAYEKALRREVGDPPIFDLILLGIGPDGHTASLFPGASALEERERFAVACSGPAPQTTRLTFTFPVLDRARQIWFLVQGGEKAEIVRQVMERRADFPAARIQNPSQRLCWLR